ncbi:plastocyanin/azurin family copper-binding protein [Actinosynnema sp. NPDC023794]
MRALLAALFAAVFAAVFLLFLSAPAAVAVAAAQGHQITIAQYAYQPGAMTVRVGETVTWTNQDQAPHDVVTTAGPAVLGSPLLAQGQSWSFTSTLPGAYDYYCSVHPDMRARVTVLPAETTPDKTTEETTQPHVVDQAPVADPPAHTSAPTTTTTATPHVVAAAPPPSNGLDPMLLLAGLVAAVTTFCLLLVGSRPEKE